MDWKTCFWSLSCQFSQLLPVWLDGLHIPQMSNDFHMSIQIGMLTVSCEFPVSWSLLIFWWACRESCLSFQCCCILMDWCISQRSISLFHQEFFITEFCFYNQTCFIVVRLSFSQFLTLLFQLVILSVIILFVNKRELIYTEIYKICQTLPLNQQDFCFCDSYCCCLNLCLSHNLVITHRILLLLLSFIFL